MSAAAPPLPPGFRLLRYETIGSTNDEAKRLAQAGTPGGTVVWAGAQTAGRGRRGRNWASPPGNLYASLLLRPDCPLAEAAQLGFVAGLSVADTLVPLIPPQLRLRLKWPNDVLLDGRKLAGILLESVTNAGATAEFVVIGVGINLASSPGTAEYPATSLAEADIAEVEPGEALAAFVAAFARWAARWRAEGFAPIRAAWLGRASGVGEAVSVRLDRSTLTGRFAGLDEAGALLLEQEAGCRRIAAGDVFPAAGG